MSTVYKKFTPQDYAIVPFNAHKQYSFTSASAASNSIKHFKTEWTSESISLYSSASSIYGGDTKNVIRYNQIDNLFYRNFRKIDNFSTGYKYIGQDNINYLKHKRALYKAANILSIPAGLFGHEVKPNSLYLSSSIFEFVDDGNGNLIVEGENLGNYETDVRSNVLNIGPVKGFKKYDLNVYDGYSIDGRDGYFYRDGVKRINPVLSYSTPEGDEYDDSYFYNLLEYKNVNFSEQTLNGGLFPGIDFVTADKSTIKVGHKGDFNFNPGEDFTINFWAKINHGVSGKSYLISKSTTKEDIPSETPNLHNSASTIYSVPYEVPAEPQFPFEVFAEGNTIFFKRSDGDVTTTINGTFTLNTMTHFTCRVQNGVMAIFRNGSSIVTGTDITKKQTQNRANVYIGSKGNKEKFLNGSMSQINIFNKALTDDQINNHYLSVNGSPYIGNIFYKNGFAVITHPKFINALSDPSVGFINHLEFRGSYLIYENEYQCTIKENEFNNTTNISARNIKSIDEAEMAGFQTSSAFKPYVTTIGLYNNNNELLIVGKLASPIKMSNETDTTFVVRWDT
tara:strand:- start:380 stop:2074 length:1695 start_codon:yes stop_codon:yes gene_type:complete